MRTQPRTVMARDAHWIEPSDGDSKSSGPAVTWLVSSNSVWMREEDGEAGDDADHGGGDAGQRGGQAAVAAQPFDVRRAEQDEQEARHERHPGGEQRREDGGDPGVEVAGVAVGADEGDELHHHDQRPGSGLGQGEAADHLARGEPAVDVDGLLRDVGEHGVGAAEGDDRGAGEEQALVDEDAGPAESDRRQGDGREPQRRSPTIRMRGARVAPRGVRCAARRR